MYFYGSTGKEHWIHPLGNTTPVRPAPLAASYMVSVIEVILLLAAPAEFNNDSKSEVGAQDHGRERESQSQSQQQRERINRGRVHRAPLPQISHEGGL